MVDLVNIIPQKIDGIDKLRKKQNEFNATTVQRGTVEWYQRLVNYFLMRRASQVKTWDLVQDHYELMQFDKTDQDKELIQEVRPGRVYSQTHTTEAMVLNRRPKCQMEGWTGTIQKDDVPYHTRIINNEWYRNYSLVREQKLQVRDCIKTGWGIMKSTYDAEFDPVAMKKQADKRAQRYVEDPALAGADIDQAQRSVGSQYEKQSYEETFQGDCRILRDSINNRRVSPYFYMQDPDSTGTDDMKWNGEIILADVEAVRNDPLLDNNKDVEATGLPMDAQNFARRRAGYVDNRNPYDFVVLYEIWERIIGGGWRYVLIAKDHPKILRVVENPYWIGNPYTVLRWNETGESCFAMSDIMAGWDLYKAERLLMTKVLDGFARQQDDTVFYDGNAGISEEQWNADCDPAVGKKVKITGSSNRPLQDLFYKLPKDEKSPAALNYLALLEREWQMSTGLGPNQVGQALKSETSATEASEVANFSRARGDHKYSAVEESTALVATKFHGLMAQFYTADRVTRAHGEEAGKAWAKFKARATSSEVLMNLRVRVSVGSMKPVDDQTRTQQLLNLAGTIGQNPMWLQMANQPELLLEIYRSMGFQEGEDLIYTPEQMQMMMQLQALQQASAGGAATAPPGAGGGGQEEGLAEAPGSPAEANQQSMGEAAGGFQG